MEAAGDPLSVAVIVTVLVPTFAALETNVALFKMAAFPLVAVADVREAEATLASVAQPEAEFGLSWASQARKQ